MPSTCAFSDIGVMFFQRIFLFRKIQQIFNFIQFFDRIVFIYRYISTVYGNLIRNRLE